MGPSLDDTPSTNDVLLTDNIKEGKSEDLAEGDNELGSGWTVVGKTHPAKKVDMGRVSVGEDGHEPCTMKGLKLSDDPENHKERRPPKWSETDFPPLASRDCGSRISIYGDGGKTSSESGVYE